MPRDVAARVGRETVQILRDGAYTNALDQRVDVERAAIAAHEGTVVYGPDIPPTRPSRGRHETRITVENSTVLEVGRRLAATAPVAALNFASATSPGGGFLNGARAQEESIARSSALYACLEDLEMYERHRNALDPFYSDTVIFSPEVPVFRVDDGDLLDVPWQMSIITCAAVHGHGVARYMPHRLLEIPEVMRLRTEKVLAVAARHVVTRLILGAWGCGAFGLDPRMMASIFADALRGPFDGVFEKMVFAITDWSDDGYFIGPFIQALG